MLERALGTSRLLLDPATERGGRRRFNPNRLRLINRDQTKSNRATTGDS